MSTAALECMRIQLVIVYILANGVVTILELFYIM